MNLQNIEHRTSNIEHPMLAPAASQRWHSMFGVQCSMFDVLRPNSGAARNLLLWFAAGWILPSCLLLSAQAAEGPLWLKGGHGSRVGAVAWSPDGTWLASASDDATVKLWTTNGTLVRTLSTHPYQATAVAFSPDGTRLAVGTYAGGYYYASNGLGRVLLWQTDGGWNSSNVTLLRTMTNRFGKTTALAFSPDGANLAAGNSSGSNIVRRVSDSGVVAQMSAYYSTNPAILNALAFSSGGLLASGCEDGTLRVCNSSWSTVLRTNNIHAGNITAVAFSPGGGILASASLDQTIRLWSTTNWGTLRTLTGQNSGIASLSFSPDGATLAAADVDGFIKWWDINSGTCLMTRSGSNGPVSSIAFSPNGAWLASAGHDKCVRIWRAADGIEHRVLGEHADHVKAVAISSDGLLCASASNDKSIQVRSLADGSLIRLFSYETGCVNSIAFSPDGSIVASAGGPLDPEIKLWSISSGAVVRSIPANTNGSTTLAFSPDGAMLASGGDYDEQTIELWNPGDGSWLRALEGHSNGVTALAFSQDSQLLVSGGRRFDNTVKVWAVTNGSLVRTFAGHEANIEAVAISPDGDTVASGSSGNGALKVWQISDGTSRNFGSDTNPVFFVAFSPDGTRLASGGQDAIRLWDVASGTVIQVVTQETYRVSCLAYSPNGNLFVYGRDDATLGLAVNPSGALGQPPLEFTHVTQGTLEAAAQSNTCYVIQYSTNLADWVNLATVRSETNLLQIHDTSAGGVPVRFYRAITPP
jgi:WD40 repeat protein